MLAGDAAGEMVATVADDDTLMWTGAGDFAGTGADGANANASEARAVEVLASNDDDDDDDGAKSSKRNPLSAAAPADG